VVTARYGLDLYIYYRLISIFKVTVSHVLTLLCILRLQIPPVDRHCLSLFIVIYFCDSIFIRLKFLFL
jgi:hypothetical protein